MGWRGRLALDYRTVGARTVAHDRHDGPLRVLRSLHPEGGVCHSVLVHPPGGMVGGDHLSIDVTLAPGSHALITTPGATRFYRSSGARAEQSTVVAAAPGSRLEWLPLETIAYSGCEATNRVSLRLAPEAEAIGWDVTALGLPASDLPYVAGSFTQSFELPGRWLDRATIRAGDTRLLESPLGWNGRRVLATMWFATGTAMAEPRRDALLEAARSASRGHALAAAAGATSPQDGVVVVRALADRVEPALDLLVRIWRVWRPVAWGLDACLPRVWST